MQYLLNEEIDAIRRKCPNIITKFYLKWHIASIFFLKWHL